MLLHLTHLFHTMRQNKHEFSEAENTIMHVYNSSTIKNIMNVNKLIYYVIRLTHHTNNINKLVINVK